MIQKNQFLLTGLAVVVLAAAGLAFRTRHAQQSVLNDGYVGSNSCRSCHAKFYQLWSTSHHGLAMQLYSREFVRASQLVDSPTIRIGDTSYSAEITDKGGWMSSRARVAMSAAIPLRRAIAADPKEAAAHFNLGVLFAETAHHDEAEKELRTAVQLDGSNASAAYDLAILVGNKNPAESLALCKKAAALDRENPKYRNAVAFYQAQVTAGAAAKPAPVPGAQQPT